MLTPAAGTATAVALLGGENQTHLDVGAGANVTVGYAANSDNSCGALSAIEHFQIATIALLNQYIAAAFAEGDGHGGSMISYPPALSEIQLTHPHA